MNYSLRTASLTTLALAALLGLNTHAHAQIVFADTFDNGMSLGTFGPGFNNPGMDEGIIVKNFGIITADVSGTGYFLFNGTNEQPISPTSSLYTSTFAVTPNTDYNLSFFLTNNNTFANAIIQAQINADILMPATGVSATGTYQTNGWQQFSFAFNSGAATNATLQLHDLVATGGGNDFGIDGIQVSTVTAVPEPGSIALFAGMGVMGVGFLRKRLGRK